MIDYEHLSLMNPPVGCRLATRCPYKKEICDVENPELRYIELDPMVA